MNNIYTRYTGNGCSFKVWAPMHKTMSVHIVSPSELMIEMVKDGNGYFHAQLPGLQPGARYFFRPKGDKSYPDPASSYQPEGVHGPSEVIDQAGYNWRDIGWRNIPFNELVLYELHVGTFTLEGDFEAIIPRLDELVQLGVNAIELMPVSQFPGNRNWGYDGVYPFAVQNTYGGPDKLKQLVDACHQKGIAVFLDVVYNHLGPEGNYLNKFGPYFTEKYKVFWGDAINFDDEWSDEVRQYFLANILYWFEVYHIDGLRVDAIHAIFDSGAIHFWELVHDKVKLLEQKLGRSLHMIAESDYNSPRVVKHPSCGGYGFSAQWLDDFHHALYVLLDKDGRERYEDFGTIQQLAKAYTDGFVHSGEFVKFRKRKHGASSVGISGDKFVVFNQNHDQVGNRVGGERLCMLVDFERQKLAAAAVLLAPYVPLLFMGEEYADQSPFFYFVSHSDEALIEAVRSNRIKEFEAFNWKTDPPDAQAEKTFMDSKLNWHRRNTGLHTVMLEWHRALIKLRRTYSPLKNFNKNDIFVQTIENAGLMLLRRDDTGQEYICSFFNFIDASLSYKLPKRPKEWIKLLDSKEASWMDTEDTTIPLPQRIFGADIIQLPPRSVVVYYSTTSIEH